MSKKTEKIELRISPEAKARLLELSRSRDETVSQLIRTLVDDALHGRHPATATTGDPMSPSFHRLKTFAASSAAVFALALGWSLYAQTEVAAQTEARVMFAEFDQNSDGTVTKEEFEAQLAREQRLEAAAASEGVDVDAVCQADWERIEAEAEPAEPKAGSAEAEEDAWANVLAEFDQDDDNRIDFQELRLPFIAEREEEFAAIDANNDDSITRAEFAANLHKEAKEGLAEAEQLADRLSAPMPGGDPRRSGGPR